MPARETSKPEHDGMVLSLALLNGDAVTLGRLREDEPWLMNDDLFGICWRFIPLCSAAQCMSIYVLVHTESINTITVTTTRYRITMDLTIEL